MSDNEIVSNYKKVVRCARIYDIATYNNIGSINLIEDLRLSKNVHETAHSRLLYKFLFISKDTDGRKDYPLLRKFLTSIPSLKDIETDLNDASIQVEREHIDVLITFDSYAIIVENKVNRAKDQEGQIRTYYEKLKSGEVEINGSSPNIHRDKIYVLYLTRMDSDSDPSDDNDTGSLPSSTKEELGERYQKISYQSHIKGWLESVEQNWNEWFDSENQKDERLKSYYSALVQYSLYINKMFEENTEDIKIMVDNINSALDLEKDSLNTRFEKVQALINPANTFAQGLECYFVNTMLQSLNDKRIVCQKSSDEPNKKIDFQVIYKEKPYRGVANVVKGYDGDYWFGMRTNDELCLIPWDGQDEPSEKISPKDMGEKLMGFSVDYTQTDGRSDKDDIFYYHSKEKLYLYWKYCNTTTIENMINQIEEYKKAIEKIGE